MARKTNRLEDVTDEQWSQVLKSNKELAEEFLEYCESIDRSPSTIFSYNSDLKIVLNWFRENAKNKEFTDINKRDVMKFQNWCLKQGMSSARIRRLRSTMSSLSNYIENMLDDAFPDFKNIISKIPAPSPMSVREKTVVSEEQAFKLLDYLVENRQYQKACVFALAMCSGSRKSELLRFKVSYFTDENIKYGALYKTPEKIQTKGRGSKGKPLNRYVLVKQFKPYFDLWMKERKQLGIESEELFVAKKNGSWEPMKISTLNSWAEQFSKILEVDFYFHSMRHYFTTELYKNSIPSEVIKDIIGWSNIGMVSIYTDLEVDDELGKYFDENGIKQVEQKTLSDL